MTRFARASLFAPGTLLLGTLLVLVAAMSWMLVVRDAAAGMEMAHPSPSLAEGAAFVAAWGVMMSAMMLPSALPMILLYRTVSTRLAADGERVLPAALFAGVYLAAWALIGVPVYGIHLWLHPLEMSDGSRELAILSSVVLAGAGVHQLTDLKRACLSQCESPMSFLMTRWRAGYGATLRLAAAHAAYCIGCCWALMLVLVAAGAMRLTWVVAITLVVLAEKLASPRWRVARITGFALLALAGAVAVRPDLATVLRAVP